MFDNIRELYNPDNDAHKVTWAEMVLANALDGALDDIRELKARVAALEARQNTEGNDGGSSEEYRHRYNA